MPRYKLTIEYCGAPFAGWQRQENGPSVQAAIEAAAGALDPSPGPAIGAGRTDAGVHALGQVAHLDLSREWEPFRLAEALNHHLKPKPVAILRVDAAPPGFHARFDAVERRYAYRIVERRAPLTVAKGLAWRVSPPLDLEAMQAAAARLAGRHDFTTFRASQCQALSPVKTLDALEVGREGGGVVVRARARSFLHNQVRSLVGTLVETGRGRMTPDDVAAALAARDRAACGPVAPPDGLYLEAVLYPDAAPA